MNTYSICLQRQFVPVDQDIHTNNLVLLNDGTILVYTEDDSTTLPNDLTIVNMTSLSIDPNENEFKNLYKDSLMNFKSQTYLEQNKFAIYTDILQFHKQPMFNSTFKTKFTKILKNKNKQSIVCCLTNNYNILVYSYLEGNKNNMMFLQNLSYQRKKIHAENIDIDELSFALYYDMEFDYTNEYLAVANRNGDVLIFKYSIKLKIFEYITSVDKICTERVDDYIVQLRCVKSDFLNELKFVAKSYKNEIYLITVNTEDFTQSSFINICIKHKDFMISDFIKLDGNCFYYISANKLYNQNNDDLYTFENYDAKRILYLAKKNQLIIYSLNEYILFDVPSNKAIKSPITRFLIRKFSTSKLDNPKLSLNINGIDIANDESFIAIAYSFSINFGITYKPKSCKELCITIFKIDDNWTMINQQYVDSLKLWYFQYKFFGDKYAENYNELLEQEKICSSQNINDEVFQKPFHDFIQSCILDDAYMGINKFAFLTKEENVHESTLYKKTLQLIYEYAGHHLDDFENDLDIFSINLIAKKLGKPCLFSESGNDKITIKGQFIDEKYDIKTCYKNNYLVSTEGHQWKSCFLTQLPIMSTHTKCCKMVNTYIIDLKKDEHLNEYGWFTSTLLTKLDSKCIVTGMAYV